MANLLWYAKLGIRLPWTAYWMLWISLFSLACFGCLEWTILPVPLVLTLKTSPNCPCSHPVWLKVHVKSNISLLLKVLYILQDYAEPCTVWLSHAAQCLVIPGFVAWCMGEWKVLPVPLITLLWCITRLEYGMWKMSLGCISLVLDDYISQKKFYRHSFRCIISPN